MARFTNIMLKCLRLLRAMATNNYYIRQGLKNEAIKGGLRSGGGDKVVSIIRSMELVDGTARYNIYT